jgi:two-component system, NtrC family, nitrogen regulation sensor histidine kinase NtrY
MGLRKQFERYRKNHRLIFAGLVGLLLVLTGLFYFLQRGRDLPTALVTNRVLLFVLWYVNVVLILTILFVLLRNVFKLLVERRHRILGSTFKFKLVATYVGLSLIPVLLLFAIATELLQGSIDRWFNTPLAPALERGNAVAQALYDRIEQDGLRDARRTLREIEGIDLQLAEDRPRLTRRLQDLLGQQELDLLAVYEGTEFVHAVLDSRSGMTDLPEPGRDFLEEAAAKGTAVRVSPPPGRGGRIVLTAVASPVPAPPPPGPAPRPVIVVAGSLIDPALAEQRDQLVQDFQTFRQLEVQKDDLRASHLLIFLMVTLLILLASSWVGLYLARRVTVPIQALAEGTKRISGGDLSHRVDVEADDELGVLVDSFNRMTAELEANKVELERSNRELVTTNQRIAAERALFAAVLANVAAGVVSADSQGRIFLCNDAALKMLRQPEDEVIGRLADEAWPDPERSKVAALLRQDGRGDRFGRGTQAVHLRLGGELKTFEAKVTALIGAGGVVQGRVLVLEDLTELIQAQQLAAWNEAARRIAHEIKNPLTPIRLAAERLLYKHKQGDPGLGKAIEDGVEIIVREVVNLQGMVDEFSRYARMPRPRPTRVDLGRLVGDTLNLYRDLKPGVELRAEIAPEVSEVWLDAEQIRRALINLLDNAVEATEAPGRVTVSAERADHNGGPVRLRIADTGRGIPLEARDKLFLPYFSTKGRGTGLGLAIVHRIVTDHQGTIQVEDNLPKGTVFTVELPG